jgi:catechol 2,3-dioxygenase-like lactoylglutathione lyase family enzyme
MRISGFVALERHVRDLRRSIDFYVDGLGFERLKHEDDACLHADALLALGNERIALHVTAPSDDHDETIFAAPDVRFQHAAIVTRDIEAALHRLDRNSSRRLTPISRGGPQRLPAASGGVTAFKFRDPDGHPLELIEFPRATAPDRWRECPGQALTLGIDHSAISVSRVERSIAFYEGLGFRVGARQVNQGEEQASLDGLDEAELDVVAMEPPTGSGPHLELLAYRQPAPLVRAAVSQDTNAAADRLLWLGMPVTPELSDPDGHFHRLLMMQRRF